MSVRAGKWEIHFFRKMENWAANEALVAIWAYSTKKGL